MTSAPRARIKAPLLHLEEVGPLVDAGADQLYAGVQLGADADHPLAVLDRRGCSPHNVSSARFVELAREAHEHGVSLLLTLNAQQIPAGARDEVMHLIESACASPGFGGVIVGSAQLIAEVRERFPHLTIVGSIVLNVFNAHSARLVRDMGVSTLVIDRQLRVDEVASIARAVPDVELEAILFHDYCGNIDGACHMLHDNQLGDDLETGCMGSFVRFHAGRDPQRADVPSIQARFERSYPVQDAACGACMVRRFSRAGVGSFKVAGRVHGLASKLRGVRMAALAIDALAAHAGEDAFRSEVQAAAPGIRDRECFDATCLIRHYERAAARAV